MALAVPETAAHWDNFADFCTLELAAGGPDPHMRYIHWMLSDGSVPPTEAEWLCGIYAVGVYNFANAEAIWREWPHDAVITNPTGFAAWIRAHWGKLKLRRERRAVRTPRKLADALISYANWMVDLPQIRRSLHAHPEIAYEEMWTEAMSLPGVGRYAGFKLLEILRRATFLPIEMPDLRPDGGWSPRLTLAALEPELCAETDAYENGRRQLARAETAANHARWTLRDSYGLDVDRYRFEVFLCDYRQSYEGRRQYPGRSNDSEIEYARKAEAAWGQESALWAARDACTPEWARGELNGWDGVRKELGAVLVDDGYTWSDYLYSYPDRTRKEATHEDARNLARTALDTWP